MSVAPIYDEDPADIEVTDSQYAAALAEQQRTRRRYRNLRLVSSHADEPPIEVTIAPAGEAERSELLVQLALRLLEVVLRSSRGKQEVQQILASTWPWTEHLPDHDVIAMVDELGELLLSTPPSESRDAAARQLLIEWENTALVWADPELREKLRGPLSLDGPEVLPPGDGPFLVV